MKNNLEAYSRKKQRSENAYHVIFTPSRLLIGVLSITLVLFSVIGVIVVITSTHPIAARATFATNSVLKQYDKPTDTPTPTSTPSPTPTITPSPTSTPSPTPTSTPSPTPTTATTPTPTPTSRPAPTPTKMASTPSPTSGASSTPSLSPTRSSLTPITSATPGATSTITAIAAQGSGQSQTPTTSSTSNTIQNASQDQQNTDFPFIALAIGVPGVTGAIAFFFLGWWLLRKRLLPVKKVKLPPSGADPWTRVRVNNTSSNMQNASSIPAPFNVANRPQTNAYGVNNFQMDTNTYHQGLHNNLAETSDLNNPYVQEVIKQYSDKSRAARQHIPPNTINEQPGQTQNNDTWLR